MDQAKHRSDAFYSFLSSINEAQIHEDLSTVRADISNFFKGGIYEADRSVNLYVMHFASGKFLYLSDTAVSFGFNKEEVYENGLEYFNQICHPEDLHLRQKRIEPIFIKILSSIEPEELINWHFSWDFRMIYPNGEIKKFIQNYSVVVDENKIPFLIFSKVREITSYYSNSKITFSAIHETPNGPVKQVFEFLPEKDNSLSAREKEILKLIRNGYSSKEIADKLYISINTVHNHRKKMLYKTGLKNTAELIDYSLKEGFI